jgi:RNA polymerase sigma-70 factor (ECF subfamily)
MTAPACLEWCAQCKGMVPDLITVIDNDGGVETSPAVGGAAADRREAFGRLAAAEMSASYQLATRILGNRGDAEEAVDEAILRAWGSFDKLRDRSAFRPWLTRIVVNVCRNDLRHRRVLQIDPIGEDDRPAADSFAGGELRDGVAHALDCLGPEQRVVVVLRYWNDLAVDEIARLLGVPSGTVKWRLFAANRRMKAELSRSGWEVER